MSKSRDADERQLEIEALAMGDTLRAPDICYECGDDFPPDLLRVFRASSGSVRRLRLCPECLEEEVEARLKEPVTCRQCGQNKDAKNFLIERRKAGHPHRMTICNDCRRAKHRERTYGISTREFDEHLAQQGGKCAICRTSEGGGKGDGWHVDHNHKTGEVRGVLCGACNTGIGLLGDDPGTMMAASLYVSSGNYLGAAAWRHTQGLESHPIFDLLDNA